MRARDRLRVIARSWLRTGRLDDELEEELRFHLARETQANIDAGMPQDQAGRAAHLSLGGIEQLKELSREARAGALARQMVRDLGHGVRLMRKAPGFAAASTAIVAIGIGATTAIFSVAYGVVLRPLPYFEPERLVSLWTRAPRLGLQRALVNAADYRDWRLANHVFEDIALVRPIANFNLVGGGEPERLFGARVSANLFSVLGVTPLFGRAFSKGEDEIGHDRVVLLSHSFWSRRFGADQTVVGREISLSGVPHTVVGVMRQDFQYPGREFQVWTPLTINPDDFVRKETPPYSFRAVARLKRGVGTQQAQAEMDRIAAQLEQTYPASNREIGVEVTGMLEDTVRSVRHALDTLLGAVACLLLVACLNLANLLGARATSRGREFAVRLALGASRGRLTLQALAEVAPLLAVGGALGLALAAWLVAAFIPVAPPGLPRVESIELNGTVLAFSMAMLVVTGLIAGLAPTAHAWRSDLASATRENTRSATGGRRQSAAGRFLVVAQIALAVPLLVGAGLLIRSFHGLTRVDPGFRSDNVLSLHLAIPRSKYPGDPQVAAFYTRLMDGVAAVPGIASVGMVNRLPLGGGAQLGNIEFENSAGTEAPRTTADWRSVTPGYFATLGLPLLEGRVFTEHDNETAAPVGIVDAHVARAMWPGQSALGRRFRIPVDGLPWVEIVGVVGHIRNDALDADPRPQVYWNYLQRTQDRMVLVVRGSQDVRALTPAILRAVRTVDPEQPVYDVRGMEEVVERSLSQRWLGTVLVGAFAVISLLLAGVGIYGVVAFGVTQRLREFGVRMALGATRSDVTRLVLRQGAALAAAGTLVGLSAALLLGGVMESLVYGVQHRDAASLGASGLLLFGVAVVASYLPARRAASVDPAITLRCD